MASTQETVQLDGLSDIDWIRYVKPVTHMDGEMYRVVTDVGVVWLNDEAHTIENTGYTIEAVSSANDYGLQLYVTPQ